MALRSIDHAKNDFTILKDKDTRTRGHSQVWNSGKLQNLQALARIVNSAHIPIVNIKRRRWNFKTKALAHSTRSCYHIFLGSRTRYRANAAMTKLRDILAPSNSTAEPIEIDVTNDESIRKAVKYVEDRFGWLDMLVNNADAEFDATFDKDASSFRAISNEAYNVNVAGAEVLTSLFAPLLIKSPHARLIFLSSSSSSLYGTHRSSDPAETQEMETRFSRDGLVGQKGYRCSKVAVNMCMLGWYHTLREDGVKTFAVSHEWSGTHSDASTQDDLSRLEAGDPTLGGQLVRMVVEGERDKDVGRVVTCDGVQRW
ncbi:NAD(P)-binding domain protein [Metarhizium rileyi]|uniref:NAD(P)-binding domain protein n=1 Tax=Metarhizium rileyi (strain RCEF 4871) TaxID=1649241 RepID=A0A166RX05_METRR|nr:NAD(P)-binding domain protein [Metarhizium rileyi RCEF 4871]